MWFLPQEISLESLGLFYKMYLNFWELPFTTNSKNLDPSSRNLKIWIHLIRQIWIFGIGLEKTNQSYQQRNTLSSYQIVFCFQEQILKQEIELQRHRLALANLTEEKNKYKKQVVTK